MAASIWQVRDDLWDLVEPMLPVHEPSANMQLGCAVICRRALLSG